MVGSNRGDFTLRLSASDETVGDGDLIGPAEDLWTRTGEPSDRKRKQKACEGGGHGTESGRQGKYSWKNDDKGGRTVSENGRRRACKAKNRIEKNRMSRPRYIITEQHSHCVVYSPIAQHSANAEITGNARSDSTGAVGRLISSRIIILWRSG